ncbi:hypothetical protein Droror1_Dr00009290 [Drosera rotundifolia]
MRELGMVCARRYREPATFPKFGMVWSSAKRRSATLVRRSAFVQRLAFVQSPAAPEAQRSTMLGVLLVRSKSPRRRKQARRVGGSPAKGNSMGPFPDDDGAIHGWWQPVEKKETQRRGC